MSSEENSSTKGDATDDLSHDKDNSSEQVRDNTITNDYVIMDENYKESILNNTSFLWTIQESPSNSIIDLYTLLSSLSTHTLKGITINLLKPTTLQETDELLNNYGIILPPSKYILHKAVIEKNYILIALLMRSNYRDLINERDSTGRTPFHLALINADVISVQLFLSRPLFISSNFDIPISLIDISFPDISLDFACIPTFHLPLGSAYRTCLIPAVEKIYSLLTGYINLVNQLKNNQQINLFEPFIEACGWLYKETDNNDIITLDDWYKFLLNFVETRGEDIDWSIDILDYPSGMTAFHRANTMGLETIVELLLDSGSNSLLKDANGNLPVHHAIKSGSAETFALLLRRSSLATSGCSPLKEETSMMALIKYCILRGAWKSLGHLISDEVYSQFPISETDFDHLAEYASLCGFRREFAEAFNMAVDNSIPLENGCLRGREVPPVKLFTSNDCQLHLNFSDDEEDDDTGFLLKQKRSILNVYPENLTRLHCLIDSDNGILRSAQYCHIPWHINSNGISMADILRVHEWSYIKRLISKVENLNNNETNNSQPIEDLDVDTPVTAGSWSAACAAAGTVISAIQAVCKGECRTAFCAIRPPGHHVGTWGACQQPTDENGWQTSGEEDWVQGSQGFCILNNVAIGAAYARYCYSELGIRRIAIVDFDVHHGNGTEQIIRNLVARKKNFTLVSSRQSDFKFTANYSQEFWKPWLDETDSKEVFFASIHGFGSNFYPGTGGNDVTSIYPHCHNIPVISKTTPRTTFREAFMDKLINPLAEFRPDLIIISAGFDGHCLDAVNSGYGGCCEDDFEWLTRLLVAVANDSCNGRLVSVLEGGYNTKGGTLSPLAQSVARHVSVLEQCSSELCLAAVQHLQTLDDSHTTNFNFKRRAELNDEINPTEAPKRRKRAAAVKALEIIERKKAEYKEATNNILLIESNMSDNSLSSIIEDQIDKI